MVFVLVISYRFHLWSTKFIYIPSLQSSPISRSVDSETRLPFRLRVFSYISLVFYHKYLNNNIPIPLSETFISGFTLMILNHNLYFFTLNTYILVCCCQTSVKQWYILNLFLYDTQYTRNIRLNMNMIDSYSDYWLFRYHRIRY